MNPYTQEYTYDDTYQLTDALGNWNGQIDYKLSMNYSNAGRIINKTLMGNKIDNSGTYIIDCDNQYNYNQTSNPYAVTHIQDQVNGLDYDFAWDTKGNMINHHDAFNDNLRQLCWTEDNRLQAVKDKDMGAYYNYDASGERNFKLTGAVVHMSQNGVPYDYVMLESPTLYASGLITINERGYTKHYFEENKRVCSNIGGGFRDAGYDIMEPIELITPFVDQWTNAKEGIFNTFDECIKSKLDLEKSSEKIVQVMKDHEKDRNEEEYQFYYTNDHLGSSTYITNKEGQITQTLAYLPYGELRSNREYLNINNKYHEQHWVDLDNQPPYLTPYKFNGKEKDPETGYNNYGARYYYDWASIWLSVDPMSDKYPHVTNYIYCANNPIMLIDPDGRNFGDYYNVIMKKIGTDGKDDKKIYIINNSADASKIRTNNKNKQTTQLSDLSSAPYELANKDNRNEMANIATSDNLPQEKGGNLFLDANTNEPFISEAMPGPMMKEGESGASIDLTKLKNPDDYPSRWICNPPLNYYKDL